jgi:competence protein ComFB
MARRESYDFSMLENEAEHIVTAELLRQIGTIDDASVCLCQECVLDMATLALNGTKPLYRVSLLGSIYAQAAHEGAYLESVTQAVEMAIEKVHAKPSHD